MFADLDESYFKIYGYQRKIVLMIGLRGVFGTSLLRILLVTNHDFYANEMSLCLGIVTECSNSWCICSITTIIMDSWEGWLQDQCNAMMDFSMRMKRGMWYDALAMMLVQWCIHHGARMTMLSMYACMRCISMMRTCMSWWCTWSVPRNYSLVTNTLLALYPRGRINR